MKDFDVHPTISWYLWNSLSLLTFTMNIRRWPDPHDDDKRNLHSTKCRKFTIERYWGRKSFHWHTIQRTGRVYPQPQTFLASKINFGPFTNRLNPNFQISRFSQTLFDVGFVIYWGESDSQRYWCWKLQLTTDEMLQCCITDIYFSAKGVSAQYKSLF